MTLHIVVGKSRYFHIGRECSDFESNEGTIDITFKEVLEQVKSLPYSQELEKVYEKAEGIGARIKRNRSPTFSLPSFC
jgi:hypothetical protein